jgi:hypothetical protein
VIQVTLAGLEPWPLHGAPAGHEALRGVLRWSDAQQCLEFNHWAIMTWVEDVPAEEAGRRVKEWLADQAG